MLQSESVVSDGAISSQSSRPPIALCFQMMVFRHCERKSARQEHQDGVTPAKTSAERVNVPSPRAQISRAEANVALLFFTAVLNTNAPE